MDVRRAVKLLVYRLLGKVLSRLVATIHGVALTSILR
jgi:hypothetical protein